MNVIQEEAWLLRDKYAGVRSPAYDFDLERLRRGEPLAYIIGWTPFLDTKIYLDSYPLIPRPETEYWTALAIAEIKKHSNPLILDLCAGSGAIGVAVLEAVPMAQVDFCEIDLRLHATIVKNICDNGIDYARTRIFHGDLFEKIPTGTQYDFILSNPPYIDPALDRAETSVKKYEPHLALYGGVAGMEIIKRIITEAPQYLAPNGALWIEHEPEQVPALTALAQSHFANVTTLNDQFGVPRFSILKMPSE